MILSKGYAALTPGAELLPWNFERREPQPKDVYFEVLYCGVCHSDLHQVRNEWFPGIFPMVPGHEIVGRVIRAGDEVTRFKPGDLAAVGCLVDSCRTCIQCRDGLEQYCSSAVATYNGRDKANRPTYGGYSNTMVVHEDFCLRVPDSLALPAVAPLLCAGITTYSPLRHWGVGKGHRLAVVGLGGLGHMAVKFGVAFGAEVTVVSTSAHKAGDARQLGAHHFVHASDKQQMKAVAQCFDFTLDTVSASHALRPYLSLLKTNGIHICVGIPPTPLEIPAFSLLNGRRSVAGSSIGGLPETQEMLDYCAQHSITADIELISIKEINRAYERMLKGNVRYRFVIDMATL
jgi:uncharacterized zinc-type alcohol dehydrogenase-like protein